jgi:hypothetical protein
MSEDSNPGDATLGWIIKILVLVVVAGGLYIIFRDQILGFFENLPTGAKLFFSLLKI